ncbi:MAG: hypothetical protein E6R03_01045 [Hyphomicrobiaceae bacterium]|nr:MAG: hypothetical protein E6R03_01045 [Hyphomicrobiaceae bacterium]
MKAVTMIDFDAAWHHLRWMFTNAPVVKGGRWQGVDIASRPEMRTRELFNVSVNTDLQGIESLDHWRKDVQPSLPWADDHFAERVSRIPVNPGETWKSWPYGHSAANFLDENGQFNHNYMERYWPKFAGWLSAAEVTLPEKEWQDINRGIRAQFGDLDDVVSILADDPLTRQAYVPIYFPEDNSHNSRKPCTLGYHFIMRDYRLHVVYYMRSCDFVRHWRDDVYLTIRLLLWMLEELRKRNREWRNVTPGRFTMHMTSLHMFENDHLNMFKAET